MRIDLNTGATNGTEKALSAPTSGGPARQANAGGTQRDTAEFLVDRVQAQALAPDPARFTEAQAAKVEALRKAVADGSYRVAPSEVAGALLAERRRP
jgi:anti-sigma28 factor (negative regulator of flagellin synthesis)